MRVISNDEQQSYRRKSWRPFGFGRRRVTGFVAAPPRCPASPALVVQVDKTQLRYHLRCIEDVHAMLKDLGDWMPLGSADEQKPAAEGTVEHWGDLRKTPSAMVRTEEWYGLKKGLRGRFAMYVPPVMKEPGLAEVEENPRNNRMRAK